MGIRLSTCTTRTELTLDLEKTLLAVEFQPQRLRLAVRLSPCHDSVGCITAMPSRLDTPVRTWCVCCQDGSTTYAWILAIRIARMIPDGSDTSKTNPL